MENCLFHYQLPSLNAAQTAPGSLRLVAGIDSFSLMALGEQQQVLALQTWELSQQKPGNQWYESELPALLTDLEMLQMPFVDLRCAIATDLVTITPNRLFEAGNLSQYFKLIKPDAKVIGWDATALPAFGCQVVWGIDPAFQLLNSKCRPEHLAVSLIQRFALLAPEQGRSVFMNIRGKQVQLLVFEGSNLLFFNAFPFDKAVDLLYYVLLVYDQFKLSPEMIPLHACGAFVEDSEYYKTLYRYIHSIRFLAPELPSGWPTDTGALRPHCWFDLLSL